MRTPHKLFIAICLLIAASLAQSAYSAKLPPSAVGTLTDYFDLLESGNIESAGYLWTEEDQERAHRFGIEYEGIPIKADCASPVMQNLSVMRNYLKPPVKHWFQVDGDNFVRLEYSTIVNSTQVEYNYYTRKIGDYYWLTFPQDYIAREWPIIETKYFRVHYAPILEHYLNPALLDATDHFVEVMADSLDIDKDVLKSIADKKIEYFYCDTDSTVKEITGHLTKGMLDLGSNDIISANFPHFHELTHLLVNIKLQHLPLYTLPVLREGIAVRYGGRWGKQATALLDLGVYLYQEQMIQLDSILTYNDFMQGSGADLSYPVAGLFVTYLMDRLGDNKFFELYRVASGNYEQVSRLSVDDIHDMLVSSTGNKDWLDLTLDFNDYLKKHMAERASAEPGAPDKGKVVIENGDYRVVQDKDWIAFEFTDKRPDPAKGNLVFGHINLPDSGRSMLFDEQYRGELPYEGYRFGVRFDQYEAGLYDYVTNQLVAKYIWGITPSPDYFNQDKNTVMIRFRKNLMDGKLSDVEQCKLLPY